MRIRQALISLVLASTFAAAPAAAQTAMYPGEGIEVNPHAATGGGGDMLLYPGGTVGRISPPLIQPGMRAPRDATPIRLVAPGTRKREAKANPPASVVSRETAPPARAEAKREAPKREAPAAMAAAEPKAEAPAAESVAFTPAAPREEAPPRAEPEPQLALAAPAGGEPASPAQDMTASPQAERVPFSLFMDEASQAGAGVPRPLLAKPQPFKPVELGQQRRQTQPAGAARVANIDPPERTGPAATQPAPQQASRAGADGNKRSEVLFASGAVEPGATSVAELKSIAADLTRAVQSGSARVQLEAFGGTPGDKGSDARRISLKRALAVRTLLIENGVPANRIDVRALGGIEDGGHPDRVDVFVRTG